MGVTLVKGSFFLSLENYVHIREGLPFKSVLISVILLRSTSNVQREFNVFNGALRLQRLGMIEVNQSQVRFSGYVV